MRRRDLERRLRSHRPADATERAFVGRALDLLGTAQDPFDRASWEPGHVTASGYVLSPDGDALLLVRHRVLGRWLQPGGHVEPSDVDVVEASRREVREETGIFEMQPIGASDALLDIDIHPIPARVGQPAHEHFDVRFLFRARSDGIRSGSDAGEVAWVRLGDVPGRCPGASMSRVLDKIRRLAGAFPPHA